mgnify:FL=1
MIKVNGHSGLYKDPTTSIFINKNKVEIDRARKYKKLRLQKKEEERELKQKVDNLQNDISELKSMFQQLLEK